MLHYRISWIAFLCLTWQQPTPHRQHIRCMCQKARAETTQAEDNRVCQSLYFTPLFSVFSYVSAHLSHYTSLRGLHKDVHSGRGRGSAEGLSNGSQVPRGQAEWEKVKEGVRPRGAVKGNVATRSPCGEAKTASILGDRQMKNPWLSAAVEPRGRDRAPAGSSSRLARQSAGSADSAEPGSQRSLSTERKERASLVLGLKYNTWHLLSVTNSLYVFPAF